MMMPDKEKVINGLCDAIGIIHGYVPKRYWGYGEQACRDAIAMLKEQKPRVLDWDEIKNYSVVWGEFRGVKDIYPLIVTLDNEGRPLSWNPNINVSDEFLFIVYDEEDRKNTRCWNHEPSDEQRQAVKWE